jgi:hypothetical protein
MAMRKTKSREENQRKTYRMRKSLVNACNISVIVAKTQISFPFSSVNPFDIRLSFGSTTLNVVPPICTSDGGKVALQSTRYSPGRIPLVLSIAKEEQTAAKLSTTLAGRRLKTVPVV